jgi:hypothetical protein
MTMFSIDAKKRRLIEAKRSLPAAQHRYDLLMTGLNTAAELHVAHWTTMRAMIDAARACCEIMDEPRSRLAKVEQSLVRCAVALSLPRATEPRARRSIRRHGSAAVRCADGSYLIERFSQEMPADEILEELFETPRP